MAFQNRLLNMPEFQMTAPNVNALFAPINSGIESYQKQKNELVDQGFRRDQLALQQRASGRADESHAMDMQKRQVEQIAGLAQMADAEKDPTRRQELWGRLVSSHPSMVASLKRYGVDPSDAINGPKFIVAQARGYVDPVTEEKSKLQLEGLREDIASAPYRRDLLKAQAAQAAQKDELNSAIGGLIRQRLNPSQPPVATPPPAVRQQSFDGTAPLPGVVLTGSGQAPQDQKPEDGTVETPLGKMPEADARILGFGLAMQGKGEAGKMFADAASTAKFGKEGQNKIDEKAINASEQQARLLSIKSMFKPEYQQFETKAGMTFRALAEKFGKGGAAMRPEDQKTLADYTAFRAEAYDNLNQYIKEITGAAMTNAEAERIMKAIPNPGDNWWDGDSPTQFKSKLDGAIRKSQMALARMEYAKREGKPWQSIPLTQMPVVIDKRGAQIEGELRRQGISADQVEGIVRQRLRAEFGIDS